MFKLCQNKMISLNELPLNIPNVLSIFVVIWRIHLCTCLCVYMVVHPHAAAEARPLLTKELRTLSSSSARDILSVGRGSFLRNGPSSNHLHAITLRPALSTPPPTFICVAPAGLTVEQFPGGAEGKYISLIKDIW